MVENDRIYVKEYLKWLNEQVDYAIKWHYIKPERVHKLTCKEIADNIGVTQATISNLTTSSKFYLLWRVAEEILDGYYEWFEFDERENRKEYPDEIIRPRDKDYVLMYLTSYYTAEWLSYK